jgi:transcriptional regulator with XRE-family HTH domain
MKRYVPDGKRIKQLREGRERAATQKEFAHEVRISERLLRQIENTNADVSAEVLDRIAKALGAVRQSIILGTERAVSAPAAVQAGASTASEPEEGILMPRFDTDIATVVREEGKLLGEAKDIRSDDHWKTTKACLASCSD